MNTERLTKEVINQIPVLSIAYLGDAIYESYIREYLVKEERKHPKHLHKNAIKYVSARSQAAIFHQIFELLRDDEKEIALRGRNAKSATVPKNTSVIDYRYSTAWETLIGYLHLQGKIDRLLELIALSIKIANQANKENIHGE